MNLTYLVPPHSVEAEQGVLGGLLLDNSAWDLIADTVSAPDFFKREHRLIFQAIQTLATANQGFDVVTMADSIAEVPEAGGLGYLSELAKNTPSVANISVYAGIVRERSHLRQLILLGHECSRGATAAQAKSAEVQEEFEQKLFALGQVVIQIHMYLKALYRARIIGLTTHPLPGVTAGSATEGDRGHGSTH